MTVTSKSGVLVTFEGIDGAGKTTQRDLAAAALRGAGKTVVVTREPGGSNGAEEIRELVLTGALDRWSAVTEVLLFAAARRDHWERLIKPALDRGEIVLCDRFIDSTRAYQAAGRGAPIEMVDAVHRDTIGREADLTLVFDVDLETAKERSLSAAPDRYERFGSGFQSALRKAFLDIAAADATRCRVIDASRDPDAIAAGTFSTIGNAINRAASRAS